ncbi:hypothetical protein [Vallicoccus soli]|uniref:Uncharacterized protein n=1 Tax=Vallicoccus soli TaxID=2339232 RepID=A0A3A3Z2B2_9ACTN|nr:hypothetical protein [Vallicoccus soli]RJK97522.1 hypothetical protein D5H78_00280 [Vallicoccus soli]
MTLQYGHWNLPFNELLDQYGEEEARRRFDAGEVLHVLAGDPEGPDLVVQIARSGRNISTYWLDEYRRPELSYTFAVPSDAPGWPSDVLLLEQSHLRAYDEPGPEADHSAIESYYFHPDGTVFGSRGPVTGDREEMRTTMPVEQLQTERVPAFGEWEPFLRRER